MPQPPRRNIPTLSNGVSPSRVVGDADVASREASAENASIPIVIEKSNNCVASPLPGLTPKDDRPPEECIAVTRFQIQRIQERLVAQQALLREFERQRAVLENAHNEILGMCNHDAKGNGASLRVPVEHIATSDTSAQNGANALSLGDSNQKNKVLQLQRSRTYAQAGSCSQSKVLDFAEARQRDSQREAENMKKQAAPLWKRVVRSNRFDLMIGFIILLNTIMMLINLELNGLKLKRDIFGNCDSCDDLWQRFEPYAEAAEHGFTAIFALEMCIRLAADGSAYLKQCLHLFDVAIVIISVVDLWILDPLGGQGMSSMTVLRLARFAKLSKVFRVVRVLKAFEPLRVLVTTIAHSVGALAWSMTLLFVCELIGSIFLAQMLQSYLEDDSNNLDMRKTVWEKFGTWSKAWYTTYEITMAPGGFIPYRDVVEASNPLVGCFIVIYGCIVTFAVIRVITALFLKETLSVCDREEAKRVSRVASQRSKFARELQNLVDGDGSGGINYEEFQALVNIPQMQEWLGSIGLSHNSAKRLFFCLSNSSTLEMNFVEFLDALCMMKGQFNISDQIVQHLESKKLMDLMTYLVALMTEKLGTTENYHRIQYEYLRLESMTF